MTLFRKIFLYSLLIILTAGYCWFIELGMGAYRILLANDNLTCWSILTDVLAIHPLPWQLLAIASLLINSAVAFIGSKEKGSSKSHMAGALCHICWIGACCFLHGIGMMEPFIIRTYVIG